MGSLLLALALSAAAVAEPAPVVLEVEPKVLAAARALGPEVAFFTSRARPLRSLAELRVPSSEIGASEVTGAREVMAFLRAGGVPVTGGATDLMALVGPHHFPSLFRSRPALRLFVARARGDGREQAIAARGGGVPLWLRAGNQTLAPAPSTAPAAPASAGPVTSFGPLVGAERSATATHRQFDARAGARPEVRTARAGHDFLIVHVDRDFSAGVGVISFLYGSGIIVNPDFTALRVRDAAGRHHPVAAMRAEGRAVALAYELPLSARGLSLEDGDATFPLDPLLSRAPTR